MSPLSKQSRDIVATIGKLGAMLDSHRSAYMASRETGATAMTDFERDQVGSKRLHCLFLFERTLYFKVDAGADGVSRKCRQLISKFRVDLQSLDGNNSTHEHLSQIAAGLDRWGPTDGGRYLTNSLILYAVGT